ncbi:MAG: STAS domain-containing protein [Candidatus Paracaedibacteraceae bacterium]|nr:STAS domain-containing protein [Candidatus Paracaedibacteraceae bacterium]
MNYTCKTVGDAVIIDIKGRLTFADYSQFRELTELFTENKSRECQLNLNDLEFIDSAGLGMLLIARDKMRMQEGEVTLRGAHGQVKKMLDLGHFSSLFRVE